MKISEILRTAADNYLAENEEKDGRSPYSCDAWRTVLLQNKETFNDEYERVTSFLYKLGINVIGFREFADFNEGEDRQGARFLWLDFAAHVAEDMENAGELDEV